MKRQTSWQCQTKRLALGVVAALLTIPFSVTGQAPGRTFPDGNQPTESKTADATATRTAEDKRTEQAISKRLQSDRMVPSYQVQTVMSNGVAVIEGKVDTLLAQERAAALARTIPGVREVQSNLQLSVPGRQDWEVISDVKGMLETNSLLSSEALKVEVEKGVVTLSGSATSEHRKYLAETLVKGIPGVVLVENEVRTTTLAKRSDTELHKDVLSAIQWDPAISSPDVSIGVENGSVAVAGVVESTFAKERIQKVAQGMGAKSVDVSQVRVAPRTERGVTPLQPEELAPTGRASGRSENASGSE